MYLVMCIECGNFVHALPVETNDESKELFRPSVNTCPECNGTNFRTTG